MSSPRVKANTEADDHNVTDGELMSPDATEVRRKRPPVPMVIVWKNVIGLVFLHAGAVYGLYLWQFAHWKTVVFQFILGPLAGLGITAGAHRLWTHRTYKAKLPLRIFLALCQTVAVQNHLIEWCRDHRVHHKFSETDADPHNATRGFFFAHMGWLMVKKHPDVSRKGKTVDMSDLYQDPVCVIQKRFYLPSVLLLGYILPTVIPWYFWNESLSTAYWSTLVRYVIGYNFTWLVNSAAHMYGNKPYDKHINPAENIIVSCLALGEGFHNYHHTFPYDYSTSEFGWTFNVSTCFIDLMAVVGLAYDRKIVSPEMILKKMKRTGDGSTVFGMF